MLLDTCAIIFAATGQKMSPASVQAVSMASIAGVLYVSAVSAWEIGLLSGKRGAGRGLQFRPDAKSWFATVLRWPGVRSAALTSDDALDACSLPGRMHADPADRFLVATARRLDVPLVTSDSKIVRYARQGWVKMIEC